MNQSDRPIYDARWSKSKHTKDNDILALSSPKTQVQFFYYYYNEFISNQIRQHFADPQSLKLLEIGCGRGTSSIYQALKLGVQISPTDYSKDAVEIASNNMKKYGVPGKAVHADMFDLPYEDSTFDVVISLGVMEHIEKATEAYSQMHKKLKPGGLMISMNVPEKPHNIQRIATQLNQWLAKIKLMLGSKDDKPWLDATSRSKTADVYRTENTGEAFVAFTQNAGFSKVNVYEINPFPTIDPVPDWLDFIIVQIYEMILWFRNKVTSNKGYLSSIKNSRTHFIVAKKS